VEIKKKEGPVGLITYMRTDSTRVSPEAIDSAREFIEKNYGKEYLPEKPKVFKSKKKNTQDAHEAIRPTYIMKRPEELSSLTKDLYSLYELIWKRFMASQMSQAVFDQKAVIIKALSPRGDKNVYLFKATGSTLKFSGFLKVYEDVKEDSNDVSGNIAEEDLTIIPPDISVEDYLNALNLRKDQHYTNPPPRYTESSLIKQLDKLGIGRPSTFANIVSTVIDRKYVDVIERRLFATTLGMSVNKVLSKHFEDVINVNFTVQMEEELDTIASGENSYKKVLDDFYIPFSKDIEEADSKVSDIKQSLIERTDIECPVCGKETGAKMLKKWSRMGQFLSCENYPECKGALSLDEPDEQEKELAKDVKCDLCGADMAIKVGRYGKFYGCTNYPKCKGIKPITLGIKCPKCNKGEIIQRSASKGRRKSKFYGCSRYPDCDFIANSLPVLQECSACGNNYLLKKFTNKEGEFLECPKCKERYSIDQKAPAVEEKS
jgi:DNA topoisomerase I